MDNDEKMTQTEQPETTATQEASTPETPAAEAPATPAPEETPEAKEAAVASELATWKERSLRLMADMDNMRKRQARELEERTARANERLLNALLPVFDHFEIALSATQEASPFVDGVKMIADEFRKVLEQSGAEVIDASKEGTPFDPMVHEALTSMAHPTIPQGQVVSQFRKGWKLGGKVVRPAQVVVSSGAPAPAPEAPAEQPAPVTEEA